MRRILKYLKRKFFTSSSRRYVNYLRKMGAKVGDGTYICSKTALIDITRPSLVTIGRDCYINDNFSLLTHDYVAKVFVGAKMNFLPSSAKVEIGNNVSFGRNVTILKGVTIGDNCFIGAHSLVTKDIPANTIAAGSPCKVICSLEEYYNRRKSQCVEEALEYAQSIYSRYGRLPRYTEFREEFPLFVDGDKIESYPELTDTIRKLCGPTYEDYKNNHKSQFGSFEGFLKSAGISL